MKKNTKILCTLGPASNSRKILKKMLKKGMDMARINTAHGNTHEYYSMVRNVRAVGKIPIVIDVKGPEVRLITNKMRNDYDNVKLKNVLIKHCKIWPNKKIKNKNIEHDVQ